MRYDLEESTIWLISTNFAISPCPPHIFVFDWSLAKMSSQPNPLTKLVLTGRWKGLESGFVFCLGLTF